MAGAGEVPGKAVATAFAFQQAVGHHECRARRHLGYVDLSGQLRSALDQFQGVHLVPFWTVTLLTLGYIAILFPLNYLVAFRWLKRPQLAWIIFPAVALLFCATAYAMAHQAKGNRLRVNQVDVVDIDIDSHWARGTTWINLFSPANAAYDLRGNKFARCEKRSIAFGRIHSELVWAGQHGLGGMNSAAASLSLVDQPYTIDSESGVVADVPLPNGRAKVLLPGGLRRAAASKGHLPHRPIAACRERSRITLLHSWIDAYFSADAGPTRWKLFGRGKPCGWIAGTPAQWKRF